MKYLRTAEVGLQIITDNSELLQKAAALLVAEVFHGKPPMMTNEIEAVQGRQVMAVIRDDSLLAVSAFETGRRRTDASTFTYLSLLATDPDERRRGYAHLLINRIAEIGRDEGDDSIVVVPSFESYTYYRHLGFDELRMGSMQLDISA